MPQSDIFLTDEERTLAENNHDLVYTFLKAHQLDLDNYYDIAVLGYLEAVRQYTRKASTQKYNFATIAAKKMQDALYHYWRDENCQKRKPEQGFIRLDATMQLDESKGCLYEIIADQRDTYRDFEEMEIVKDFLQHLTEYQRQIIILLMFGYTSKEIQKTYGFTKGKYYYHLNQIQKKAETLRREIQ